MRDVKIDFLRFVGLSMIILAHVGPSGILFQARNFDVPLMVLVSGLSYFVSYKRSGYLEYISGRFKRLVIPVWVFLTGYFSFVYFFNFPIELPSFQVVLSSYLLLNGIGYVWIIRVFLLVAIVSPYIYRYSAWQNSNFLYLISLLAVLVSYELAFYFFESSGDYLSFVFDEFVFYLIPYSLVFAFGLRLAKLSSREIFFLTLFFLVCFFCIACFEFFSAGKIVSTQYFKYPPRLYYLSYAGFVSIVLWVFSERIFCYIIRARLGWFVGFVANNSIWVYLWHIPFVGLFDSNVFVNWVCVFGCAFVVSYAQVNLVNRLILPRINNGSLARNFKSVLTG